MKAASLLLVLVALLLLAGSVLASAGLTLPRQLLGGGGGAAQGGAFALHGSVGQAVAGGVGQGSFGLVSGFWNETAQIVQRIYVPVVLRHTS